MGKKEDLIEELRKRKDGQRLADSLEQDLDYVHLLTQADIGEAGKVIFTKGRGPQSLEEAVDTNWDSYYDNVIQPRIDNGTIDDKTISRFDDRKVRLSGKGVVPNNVQNGSVLIIEVGPTDYVRFKEDMSRKDLEANYDLMLRGLRETGNPWEYYARPVGVAVVPISREGHIYIGERASGTDRPGELNFVAGQMTFNKDINQINAYKDAERELKEEFGIEMKLTPDNTILIGISANPTLGDSDIVFAVHTDTPDEYFESGEWKKHVSEREHKELVGIKNREDVVSLLTERRLPSSSKRHSLIYSSRLGLEWLAENHFR